MLIGALLMGYRSSPPLLFAIATAAALVQVVVLRLLFFPLQLHRGILVGAVRMGAI